MRGMKEMQTDLVGSRLRGDWYRNGRLTRGCELEEGEKEGEREGAPRRRENRR